MEKSMKSSFQFSTESMREHRKTWSLRNDVDLLNNLETFSQGLMKKTYYFLDSMEEFHRDVNVTSIGVKTLSNTFEGISDRQFVENRVYDEDDEIICDEDKYETDSSTSLNLNKRLEESLKICSRTLKSKFEALSTNLSESEDDSNNFKKSKSLFISKKEYKSRPLPHLVGGKDFYLDDSLNQEAILNVEKVVATNPFNREDDEHHSEPVSIDEIDNYIQRDESLSTSGSKVIRMSTSEQNEGFSTNIKENDWKDIDKEGKICVNDFSDVCIERQTNSENLFSSKFQNMPQVTKINTSIADEIKSLFSAENHESNPKFSLFKKTQHKTFNETIEETNQVEKNVDDIKKSDYTKKFPPKSFFKDNNPCLVEITTKSNQIIEEKMSEDNDLPNNPTEVLHSYAKNRVKIKGKRRLPSRKLRSVAHIKENSIVKQEIKENMLSPSTDEEDLFVLPQVCIPPESSSNSLFGASNVFSPGSPPEEHKKKKNSPIGIPYRSNNEEVVDKVRKCSFVGEPLGIEKTYETETKSNNLFSDWDPFNAEETGIFSSVEKRSRKTKLFDEFRENSEQQSSKDTSSDDLFFFSNNSNSNATISLFSKSSSTDIDFTLNKPDSRKLFDNDDDDTVSNLFSSSDKSLLDNSGEHNKKLNHTPNLVSRSERKDDEDTTNEKFKNVFWSNPLMDTDDNLFD